MKKVLFIFALVLTYAVSVSTASANVITVDDVKTTVVADDGDKVEGDKEKEAKATKADGKAKGCSGSEAKAEGCSGKTAKAEGCSGKTAKAEGCDGKSKTASKKSGSCGGEKVAEK